MENELTGVEEIDATGADVSEPQKKKDGGTKASKSGKMGAGAEMAGSQEKTGAGEVYRSSFAKFRVPICFAAILLVSVAAIACLVSEVLGMVSPVTFAPVVHSGDPINAVSYLVLLIMGMAGGMQQPFQIFISVILTISVLASLGASVTALVFGIRALLPGQKKLGGMLVKISVFNIAVNALVMTFISMTAKLSPFAANDMGYAPSPVLVGAIVVASVMTLYVMVTDIVLSGKLKDKQSVFEFMLLCVKLALAVAVLCVISTTEVLTVAMLANANAEFFAYVFAVLMLLAAGTAADTIVFYSFKLENFDKAAKKEPKKEFILGFISAGLMFLVFCFGIAFGHVIDFANTQAVNLMGNSIAVLILIGIGLGVLLFEKTLGGAKTETPNIIAE